MNIRYCFTVIGKKYAITLANTLALCRLKQDNIEIFADQEASEYLNSKNWNTRQTEGINVYQDKICNAMLLSSELKDTLVIALDCTMMIHPWEFRDFIDEYESYFVSKSNSVFLITPEYYVTDYKKTTNKLEICGGLSMYYNMTIEGHNQYKLAYENLKDNPITFRKQYEYDNYYRSMSTITEEEVFENIIAWYNNVSFAIYLDYCDSIDFRLKLCQLLHDGYGSLAINDIIKTKRPHFYCHYFFLPEYFNDLMTEYGNDN